MKDRYHELMLAHRQCLLTNTDDCTCIELMTLYHTDQEEFQERIRDITDAEQTNQMYTYQ